MSQFDRAYLYDFLLTVYSNYGSISGLDWPLCHCAVAQAPAFDEHGRPLAPSKF